MPFRAPVLAANWKMNHGPTAAGNFVAAFLAAYPPRDDRTVVIIPPALTLAAVRSALAGRPDIVLGVQNIHDQDKGAFTGENSAPMAKDAGASLVLVGHSERRHVFGEPDDATGRKVAAALKAGLTPMLCVGEKLEERERGETDAVVLRQLRAGLAHASKEQLASTLIAYEPVWAIGTGKTATPDDAAAVHAAIRRELMALSGGSGGRETIPILYGGSVTKDNARALLSARDVGGLLVGGASLDATSWSAIAST